MKTRRLARAFLPAISVGLTATAFSACSDPSPLPAEPDAAQPDASVVDAIAADVSEARAPYDGAPATVTCETSPCAVRLVAGHLHYCTLIDDGTVRCWGEPSRLGAGDLDGGAAGAIPAKVVGLSGVVDLVALSARTCAVLGDGGVDCWSKQEPTPARLTDVGMAKRVSLGPDMSCAVETSGALACWGTSSVFGSGRREIDLGGPSASAVSITERAAFVIDSEGDLRSWGSNLDLLGRDTSVPVDLVPRPVNKLPKILDVASSSRHACVVSTDGRLFCWGIAGNGMLGLGYIRDERFPVALSFPELTWPQQVSVTDTHSCVRMTNETVSCWGGLNPWGELGISKRGGVYVPTQVVGLPAEIVSVAVGLSSTCALTKRGVVWCWGANDNGQLGRGTRDGDRHSAPEPVIFP